MGVVYQAESLTDGRIVALKLLSTAFDEDEGRKRFLREGRLAARLNHPNTVYVFGSEEVDGTPMIVMEYVAGGTLEDRVRARGPMPIEEAIRTLMQIVDGLDAALATGILHRDVKPSNCFVAFDGLVKVGDFGLSRPSDTDDDMRVTRTGMILGTPVYASPEQLLGEEVDVTSDIYSVGATMYFLLTAALPFEGSRPVQALAEALRGSPTPPETHRPGIPKPLSAVVLKCMSRNAADRYSGYHDLREALQEILGPPMEPARPALRATAFAVDVLVASGATGLSSAVITRAFDTHVPPSVNLAIGLGFFLLIRAVPTYTKGASEAQSMAGMRVATASGGVPSVGQIIGRNIVLWALISIPGVLALVFGHSTALSIGAWSATLVGVFVFLAVMQPSTGYASVHDRWFGTRVLQLAGARRRTAPVSGGGTGHVSAASQALRVGPYALGELALARPDGSTVVHATDTALRRPVWVHLVGNGVPARNTDRRDIARVTRLRFIAGQRTGAQQWDAYGAPDGCHLREIGQPIEWDDFVPWFELIARELVESEAAGEWLEPAVDDVWITLAGNALLLDFAERKPETEVQVPATWSAGVFLTAVAHRALGGPGAQGNRSLPALPLRIRRMLDSLPSERDARAALSSIQALGTTSGRTGRRNRLIAASVLSMPAVFFATLEATSGGNVHSVYPVYVGAPVAPLELMSFLERPGALSQGPDQFSATRLTTSVAPTLRRRAVAAQIAGGLGWLSGSVRGSLFVEGARYRNRVISTYLASTHRDALTNPLLRSLPPPNALARRTTSINATTWPTVDAVLAENPAVPPSDSATAARIVEREWRQTTPLSPAMLLRASTFAVLLQAGLLLTGLLVAVTAVTLRRGPLLRLAGLDVIDRSGAPASRARLLVRALATWAPLLPIPLLVVIAHRAPSHDYEYMFNYSEMTRVLLVPAVLSLLLGAAAGGMMLRNASRSLGDRIAGTSTVGD